MSYVRYALMVYLYARMMCACVYALTACFQVVHVSDQSCFFMQRGVSERDVQFTEVEQTLSGMGRLEKLVLSIDDVRIYEVSLIIVV